MPSKPSSASWQAYPPRCKASSMSTPRIHIALRRAELPIRKPAVTHLRCCIRSRERLDSNFMTWAQTSSNVISNEIIEYHSVLQFRTIQANGTTWITSGNIHDSVLHLSLQRLNSHASKAVERPDARPTLNRCHRAQRSQGNATRCTGLAYGDRSR